MKTSFILNKNTILIVSLLLYTVLIAFFYYQSRQYAINTATEKIEEVLLNTQAIRKYVSIQKKEVYRLQEQKNLDEEYFSPILLSSTFSAKQVNNIYNALRNQQDKAPVTIKFAATNPRNDANIASDKEQKLLQAFNQDRMKKYKELIRTDRGEAIFYAVPTRPTTKQCALCHSDPELAPGGLVAMYGDKKGFYEHTGDIRAVLSTTYPIEKELADARLLFYLLSIAAFVTLLAIVLISYRYINIIKSKQKQLQEANENLTDKVDAQTRQISRQHEYLDLILNASPNIILVSDLTKLTFANEAFFSVFSEFSALDEFNRAYNFKDYVTAHLCDKKIALQTHQQWLDLFVNRHQKLCFGGAGSYYHMITTPFVHDEKKLYLHILSDITALERTKQQLQEQSIKDELTGLYNRRHFNTVYDREIKRAARDGMYLVFAIMDIDYFKDYNDMLGHKKGDKALAKVASLVRQHFSRSGDFVFRMGGEEFSVITTTKSLTQTKEHFHEFHRALQALHLPHPKSRVASYLTVSVGVFAKTVEPADETDFYKEADNLLYAAKQKRNDLKFNF
ncbi:MAG: diguanylate cyclase [Campylobacterota bacterium]